MTPVADKPAIIQGFAGTIAHSAVSKSYVENPQMKILHSSILLILGFAFPLANGQKNTKKPHPGPVETTVCEVLGDPSGYNNRLVKVRGWVSASSEYSLLV